MSYCGDFSNNYIMSLIFSLLGFRINGCFSVQWFQVRRVGEKLKMLAWGVAARHWRKLEEFRIRSSLQWTVLEYNIHKGVKLKHNCFLFTISLISTKDSQMKTNLLVENKSSFNKIGLIVCINAARAVAGHIGSYKSALLELSIMSLQIEIFNSLWRWRSQAKYLPSIFTCQEVFLLTHLVMLLGMW